MTDADELTELEATVESPGWHRVKAKFDAEWGRAGVRFVELLEKMANDSDKGSAAENMQKVIWVRKEMENFLRGIEQRVVDLKNRTNTVATMSRRGVL